MNHRSLFLSLFIVLFFFGGLGLFAFRAKAQGVPPASSICVIIASLCQPPPALPPPSGGSSSSSTQVQKTYTGPLVLRPGDEATFLISYQASRGSSGAPTYQCGPDSNRSASQDLVVAAGQTFYIGDPRHIPSNVPSSQKITAPAQSGGFKLACRSVNINAGATLVVRTRLLLVSETIAVAGMIDGRGLNGSNFNGSTWESSQNPLHSNGGSGGAINDNAPGNVGQAKGGSEGGNGTDATLVNGLGLGSLGLRRVAGCFRNIDSDICAIFKNLNAGNGGKGRDQSAGVGGQGVGGGGASEEFGNNAGAVFGGGGGYGVTILAKNSINFSGNGKIDVSGGIGGGNGAIYFTAGGGGGSAQVIAPAITNAFANSTVFAKAGQSRCERGGCSPGNGVQATDGTIQIRSPNPSEIAIIDRSIGRSDVLGTCSPGAWFAIADTMPDGFNFSSASIAPNQTRCPTERTLVWDSRTLDQTASGSAQGSISLNLRIDSNICANKGGQLTFENKINITIATAGFGSQTQSNSQPATVIVQCPGIGITGNVSSVLGDVDKGSNLQITGPAVVTAAGKVGLVCSASVICIGDYPIDLTSTQSQMTKTINRIIRELALSYTGGLLVGIYRIQSPATFTGLAGTGTIIVDGTGDVTIGDNVPTGLGIVVNNGNTVRITGANISGLLLYAPLSTVDFGSARNINIKGIFIANRFANLNQQSGSISYDSSLVKSPPPGLSQIIQPFIVEQIP